MKEYYVFAGSFGSGKSELAINLAIRKAAENPPCTLVDMDVINPYFRSSERSDLLEKFNVRLISPPFAMHKIEIMSLSPEVYSAFAQKEGTVIFDAGGDPVGAVSLGQFYSHFCNIPSEQLNIFMVINPPVRPWKSSKTPWSRAANCSSIVPSSIQRAAAPTLTSITFRVMKLPTNWETTRSATWSGAYLEKCPIVQIDSVLQALLDKLGKNKAHLIPMNREAFAKGAEVVK